MVFCTLGYLVSTGRTKKRGRVSDPVRTILSGLHIVSPSLFGAHLRNDLESRRSVVAKTVRLLFLCYEWRLLDRVLAGIMATDR